MTYDVLQTLVDYHYWARDRLFPAVEKNPEAIVVAPGVSCRQQVEHATGRRVLHPAEALMQAL